MTENKYKELCERFIRAIDSGNVDAEENVICNIRATLINDEYEKYYPKSVEVTGPFVD